MNSGFLEEINLIVPGLYLRIVPVLGSFLGLFHLNFVLFLSPSYR